MRPVGVSNHLNVSLPDVIFCKLEAATFSQAFLMSKSRDMEGIVCKVRPRWTYLLLRSRLGDRNVGLSTGLGESAAVSATPHSASICSTMLSSSSDILQVCTEGVCPTLESPDKMCSPARCGCGGAAVSR